MKLVKTMYFWKERRSETIYGTCIQFDIAMSFQYSQLRLHSATEQSLAMVMSVDLLMVAKPHTTPSLNMPRWACPEDAGRIRGLVHTLYALGIGHRTCRGLVSACQTSASKTSVNADTESDTNDACSCFLLL